jgi:acetylornithine aminotransferase/acetylornithine/N-succinyldiaminopimelate aminotransferase
VSNIQEREAQIHMQTARRLPVTLVKGEGTRVWDEDGKEYLDFIAGIASTSLGHANPGLAKVIAEQAKTLVHVSNVFYSVPQIELAELLVGNSCFDRAFFVNSGAEANEGAIKLARKWGNLHRGGAFEIISTNNSFHGRTMATVSATGTAAYREGFGPPLPGFVFVDYDDLDAIKAATTGKTVAMLLEAVQGEGGVNVPDDDYLRGVRAWCDERDMLLILDEVQTGVGRTGTLWAYEQTGIEPDIMTLAKGLGGGVPIGCLLAKEAASVFEPGDHGSTFGGNPLATAAGTYVMQQLIYGGVMENVVARSEQLTQRLESLADRNAAVEGQRGKGLLRALVLTEEIAGAVAQAAMERGLFVNAVRPNAIRFMPALTVTEDEIDRAVAIIEDSLSAVTS